MPYADVVTSTTHKTLRGPRGGIILSNNEELGKKFNSLIFPGIQGGPLEHVIAAKAVAFKEALAPEFISYQEQVIKNSKMLASTLLHHGIDLVSGGTDNHLVLVKTDSVNLSGKEAGEILEKVDITCNKNMVPNDKRSPFVTSGIRLGSPALTTRGFRKDEFERVGNLICDLLDNITDEKTFSSVKDGVKELTSKFPMEQFRL
jgi:glycine hydroxymethyltransferase